MRVVSQNDPSKCREVPGSDPTPALASATGPEVTIASRPDYGPVANPKPRQLCLAYFRDDKTVARYAAADGQCIVWRWLNIVPC